MDYSQFPKLEFRRKFWKFFGAEISIFDPAADTLVGFIKLKAFTLREDIRIFTDKTLSQEVLKIHARNIIDISATYDVTDSATGELIFSLKRKGMKSAFVRDHWDLLDGQGKQIGAVQESSSGLALLRRWLDLIPIVGPIGELVLMFVPQTYDVLAGEPGSEQIAAVITHRKNPVIVKLGLDKTTSKAQIDPRVNLAVAALLSTIDAAKN